MAEQHCSSAASFSLTPDAAQDIMCRAKHQHAKARTATHTSEAATHQFSNVRVGGDVEMAIAPEDATVDLASCTPDCISDLEELLMNAARHPTCHLGVAHAANLVVCAVEAVLNCLFQELVTCKQGCTSEA